MKISTATPSGAGGAPRHRGGGGARSGTRRLGTTVSVVALLVLAMLPASSAAASGGAIRDGFDGTTLARNDDGSSGLVGLGFTIDFFGAAFTDAYVNNNGNITFDAPLATFTPFEIESTSRQIIAPFFADVDTRNDEAGDPVRFGAGTVDGRPAWGVSWENVDCYSTYSSDNLDNNWFQLVLIDRSDINPGDFDVEFNYDQIVWEAGSASGSASDCTGGSSARVGYANGSGDPGTSYELPGSAVNGAFLDSNLDTGLVHNNVNSDVLGRYVFQFRNGEPEPLPEDPTCEPGMTPAEAADAGYNVILGTHGDDELTGTSGPDAIFAYRGNDMVYARGGDDCVFGSAGNDYVKAGGGDDIVYGQGGSDKIDGNGGDDHLHGGGGSFSVIHGGAGFDVCDSTAGGEQHTTCDA